MVNNLHGKNLEQTLVSYVKDIISDVFDGDKFPGSFGLTKEYVLNHAVDYFTLRRRCYQLFIENTYFQGLIKRILRNEIFTGMYPEPTPIGSILWPDISVEDQEQRSADYAEIMNTEFMLYANNYEVFDYKGYITFGEFQEAVRQEAIICGDVVIVSRINRKTNLPCWDVISGNSIETPLDYHIKNGNSIVHGVERDAAGRHVAYWVKEYSNGEFKHTRIPVYGEKSGRQISWMVYGGNKLLNEVRGTPVLANALYMLRDLDRYRDAELRAAVIGSIIALFIEKSPTANPTGSGVISKDVKLKTAAAGVANTEPVKESPRQVDMIPGTIIDDMKPGETIKSVVPTHPNINLEKFEKTIIYAIAWGCLEIPPEIAVMVFQNNYSASRQASVEFEMYLNIAHLKTQKIFVKLFMKSILYNPFC